MGCRNFRYSIDVCATHYDFVLWVCKRFLGIYIAADVKQEKENDEYFR